MDEKNNERDLPANPPPGRNLWVLEGGYHDTLPTRRVVWGEGALTHLGAEVRRLGLRRILLLTTSSLAREQSLLASVEQALGSLLAARFDQVAAHVPHETVSTAVAGGRAALVDGLVTFGGGSVIDTGKAVAAALAGKDVPPLSHIALPTTLSGAEFSHVYGVTYRQGSFLSSVPFKRSFAQNDVTPTTVILDPHLTTATPPVLWSSSGIKALDHAIEGLLNPGQRPITDPLALVGISGMASSLVASQSPAALEERLCCQIAAWQCYFAPATIHLGLSHRLGQVLGGSYHVPHSLTSCITLAPVMRLFAHTHAGKLAAIARALSTGQPQAIGPLSETPPIEAAEHLEALIVSLGLPHRLQDVGLARADLPKIHDLMVERYPSEVAQLGADASSRLARLLEEMW